MTAPVPHAVGTLQRTRNALPLTALLGAVLACIGAPAHAQPQETLYTANYRDTDIRALAEQIQAVTGRNIIIDPRVRAQVTVLSNEPMSADALYRLFLATLEVHGFIPLESGNAIMIVPDSNARTGQGDDFVTQAVVLNNIGAAQLVPVLRPLLPQSAHLAAHPSSNALIIADRPQNFRRILELIRRMDQDGAQEIEVIALENAGAEEVVRMLSSLNQASQAAGGSPPIQAIPDTRTNSVLLSGPAATRLQYRALIAHLDTPSAEGGDTLVLYLNYADAEELATKLQAQFGGGGGAAPAEGAPPGTPNAGPVTIWADTGTNALVINAPERVRQDMIAVIQQIDIPRLQVQVEAIIVELSEERAAELGVTWAINGANDDRAVGLTNFSSTTGGILQLGAAAEGDTPDPGIIRDGLTLALGRISDTGTSWAAIVSALRGDADTNIVSMPSIITLDNEEAEISVGQEVPFLTGQFTNTGAGGGNSVNPFQTIQREEVGTSLKITPQINEGSGVNLAIEQETSSISQGASGAVDIVTNTRTIKTSVFVPDGDVLILGGLIDDKLLQGEQRVPGLGSIPGLGWLFRARRTEHQKTNLMVFIRPTILHNRTEAAFYTSRKYQYVQELQRQMAQDKVNLMKKEPYPTLPPLVEPTPETVQDDAAPDALAPDAATPNEPDGGQPQ